MAATYLPVSNDIEAIFRETVGSHGEVVSNCLEYQTHLFMRSTTPRVLDVRPQDFVQGGVALRMFADEFDVCPYVFRQVCRNSAMMTMALESFHVQHADFVAPTDEINAVLEDLRQLLQWCLDPSVLDTATNQMQMAARTELARYARELDVLPDVEGISQRNMRHQILRRLRMEQDWTMYGLMNAVILLRKSN